MFESINVTLTLQIIAISFMQKLTEISCSKYGEARLG